jgi:hypothetical protein
LLNARLSVLARQFDAARGDLRWCKGAIERYFDRSSRRTQIALDLVMQVEQQSRQSRVRPRASRVAMSLSPPASRGRGWRPAQPSYQVRLAIWFVLLFAVAVVAAATFGTNDGLASFYWGRGGSTCRSTSSCCCWSGTCFLLVAVIQAINSLIGLPQRAPRMAHARRDRTGRPRCATRWHSTSAAATRARRSRRSAPSRSRPRRPS